MLALYIYGRLSHWACELGLVNYKVPIVVYIFVYDKYMFEHIYSWEEGVYIYMYMVEYVYMQYTKLTWFMIVFVLYIYN